MENHKCLNLWRSLKNEFNQGYYKVWIRWIHWSCIVWDSLEQIENRARSPTNALQPVIIHTGLKSSRQLFGGKTQIFLHSKNLNSNSFVTSKPPKFRGSPNSSKPVFISWKIYLDANQNYWVQKWKSRVILRIVLPLLSKAL